MSVLPWSHARASLPAATSGEAPSLDPPSGIGLEVAPLARRFVAYRQGRLDGTPHSLDETAEFFGLDTAFARRIEAYILARQRVRVGRAGWRASLSLPR